MARLTKLDTTESALRRSAASIARAREVAEASPEAGEFHSTSHVVNYGGGGGWGYRSSPEAGFGFAVRLAISESAFHGSLKEAVRTVLQDLEMLPQDVAHEGRGTCQKGFLAHGTNLFAGHVLPGLHRHTLQREFTDGPVQPVGDSCFRPLPRVWKTEEERLR